MTDTDRALLEKAAKAAGIELEWEDDALHPNGFCWVRRLPPHNRRSGDGECWNPLTDDGDALRLAVKLNLTIQRPWLDDERTDTREVRVWSSSPQYVHESLVGVDPYAATRRAIVRAAASMVGE